MHDMTDERAARELKSLGRPITINPVKALLSLVHEAAGNVAFYREIVQEMGVNVTVPDRLQTETARAAIKMYNEERDRLERYSQTCIKIGLAERMVKVEEKQAENIVVVIRALIRRLGLDTRDMKVIEMVREEMRRLDQAEVIEMPSTLVAARGGNTRSVTKAVASNAP